MSTYKDASDALEDSLNFVRQDSPEAIKVRAAIAALDDAETARIKRAFIDSSRRLEDATAKLQAIVAGLQPNAASQFLARVTGALNGLTPIAQNVDALLSGEPASALPGMAEVNLPTFPTAAETVVPPVREFARAAPSPAPQLGAQGGVDQMIEDILRREGGFVDHPNDRGGPTNFGVTLKTLMAFRGRALSAEDVRRMAVEEARDIYRSNYFLRPKIDQLPALLQPQIFDMAINHGPGTAIKLLQSVLTDAGHPCAADGGIGDETTTCAKAAVSALGNSLSNLLVEKRIDFYEAIVDRDASQGVFLRGWLRRANEFRA